MDQTSSTSPTSPRPARLFISYSRADAAYLTALETHLATLKRQKRIDAWTDRALEPGASWSPELLTALRRADIVLLLVSPDFMASDYIHDVELKETFDRHAAGSVRVIPILVRPTDLKDDRLDSLQGLPRDRKPISQWTDRDEAWLDVLTGIRKVLPMDGKKREEPKQHHSPAVMAVQARVESKTEAPTGPSLTLLHLSDLHFGQDLGQGRVHFDQKKVLEELRIDAQKLAGELGAPDLVVVTGDIAFSGQPSQYKNARRWLLELASAVGVDAEQIWLVPGNHDVDRAKATHPRIRKNLHRDLRGNLEDLNDYLLLENVSDFAGNLWPKFEAFAEFSVGWGSPGFNANRPYWRQEAAFNAGKVMLLGLNSSLLCLDHTDAKSTLALSRAQLELLDKLPSDALILVAAHHPPEWLSDGDDLWKELQKHPHLLLTGHVHQLGGGLLQAVGQRARLRSDAGAAHADTNEPPVHTYAWICISREGVDWYPRAYTEAWNEFRTFADKLEDRQHFQRLELPAKLKGWLEMSPPPPVPPLVAV